MIGATNPLLLTPEGKKMGKTEKGAIWIEKDKISAYDFYQGIYQTPDACVEMMFALFTDITDEMWHKMIDTNLSSAFYASRAVLPGMISRKDGVIINVSSMWGQVGASCETHYSVSKAGMIGLTKALAKEVGPSNIRVNCVCPGTIDTEMNSHLSSEDKYALINDTPLGKIGKCEDVVNTLIFVSEDKSSFITGQIVAVNGGYII